MGRGIRYPDLEEENPCPRPNEKNGNLTGFAGEVTRR